MANTNTPFGLKPVLHRNGQPYNGAVNPYYVPAAYATALFVGDPVVITGTANTTRVKLPSAGSFEIGTLPAINKATAGTTNRITGVIVGFSAEFNSLTYNAASTERIAYVCDDPDVMFEIQADGALAAVDVGLNACVIYTVAGSTNSGLSGVQLDTTSAVPATTVGFQLKINRLVNREDNEAGTAYTKALVTINQHTLTAASTGI